MDKIFIKGGKPLKGTIAISGSKNAALPIMAASLLTADTLILSNIPLLADITTMSHLLTNHGVSLTVDGIASFTYQNGRVLQLNAANVNNYTAPYDIVRKMRASVWVLGPLLARFGQACVSLPGGCAIGNRPIDLHISALEKLGASIELKDGYIIAHTKSKLKGANIRFDKVSVGATANIMMAATLAEGYTTITNVAKEPEICDLAVCLKAMGAQVEGVGTDTITIEGVKQLHGTHHTVIPDRIEAGTYAIAAAITGGEINLTNINQELIDNIIQKLEHAGVSTAITDTGMLVKRSEDHIYSTDIHTQPYPGFPTDMQAQFMALMSIARGSSLISENIFENRFMHASELMRMGADITVNGSVAMVKGINQLKGAPVMATDLRASVSLVLAALAAKGNTQISRVYHIDRGYERIEEKLVACGADIERIK
ncbi:UDP-N-acetylglucosamine 1-carboxyvinyltransferase [Rickettsiales bacterium Ac37b]|nr:UDP-N-acetylglucosamine 1-carboxyvinyltransferase [Rickettsiales bacterium Ac37b]